MGGPGVRSDLASIPDLPSLCEPAAPPAGFWLSRIFAPSRGGAHPACSPPATYHAAPSWQAPDGHHSGAARSGSQYPPRWLWACLTSRACLDPGRTPRPARILADLNRTPVRDASLAWALLRWSTLGDSPWQELF